MKIIDLLNKIANGEEVPKKIKYKGHIYQYQYKDIKEVNIINYYHSEETHHHLIDGGWHDIRLNDEVEILEEKKIPEKLNYIHPNILSSYNESELLLRIEANKDKINEIIDYLKSKGE